MFIIGQILTAISYIVYYISRFKKDKKDMLLWDNISVFFTLLSFVFLKSYEGASGTLYSYVRNKVQSLVKGNKKNERIGFWVLLIVLLVILGVHFNGLFTLFLFLTNLFNLVGVMFFNPQGIRLCGVIASVCYLSFQIILNNYVGIICEIITMVVTLLSFVIYLKKGKDNN